MKSNVTLIGMPGAGKSTVGIILAKMLSYGFVDTDVLIQTYHQKSLQRILEESGYLKLREIESERILNMGGDWQVIATGGSAVYSDPAMKHLEQISIIVFLKARYETLKNRIQNFDSRGIAKAAGQTFRSLFEERQPLYERYAELTFEVDHLVQEKVAEKISQNIKQRGALPVDQ